MSILHRHPNARALHGRKTRGVTRARSNAVVAYRLDKTIALPRILTGARTTADAGAAYIFAPVAKDLASHVSEWRALCDEERASCFARPEWVLPYAKAFEPSALIVFAYEGPRLVGAFPCCERRRTWGRTLSTLGGEHIPELAFALSGDRDRLLARFVEWVFARGDAELDIPRVSIDSPIYAALERAFVHAKTMRYERVDRQQHHTVFDGDFATFLRTRSKNFRKQVGRAERAAKTLGLSVETLSDRASIEQALPDLAAVSAASWQGKNGTGTFANATYRRCYADAAMGLAEAGLVRLIVCRRRGTPVGFILHFVERDRLVALKSEFVEVESACMAGWQIAAAAIDEAHALGLHIVTSGSFVTDFKERWTTHTSPCADLAVFAPSVAGGLSFAFPHLATELVKRAWRRPSVARCLPVLDWSGAPPFALERQGET